MGSSSSPAFRSRSETAYPSGRGGRPLATPKALTRTLAPGVRLHLLPTDRFATTVCRVVLHRDLGPEATATSLLANVLQSATARHPTREALAHRLDDLYGASLHVSVGKSGDRQLLTATLEWPTAHVPRAGKLLGRGLTLLREVFTEPKRAGPDGAALDPELVETERLNLQRALGSLKEDRFRHAVSRAVAEAFADEPHGLEALGREEDLADATPEMLGALHARLIERAPVDVFLVGDVGLREAVAAVRGLLLWPGRAARPSALPPAGRARPARGRVRRVTETDQVVQEQLVMIWRGRIGPRSPLVPAAWTLAGLLGGGSFSRLFKVVRETHGLCYFADAGWNRAKGYMLVHTAIDPGNERRVARMVRRLEAEVAAGDVDPDALAALRETAASRVAAMGDDRGALIGWHQGRLALGLDASPRQWLDEICSVTPAALRRAGRAIGLDTRYVLSAPS